MGQKSKFEKDFCEVAQLFPKLNYKRNDKSKSWTIYGKLDICDNVGDYWDTFDIAIYVSDAYPYCIPLVKERSKFICREPDWHIDQDGYCCVDIEHKLLILKRKGINLAEFIKSKVYPYFANQVYKKSQNDYAAGEYGHNFDGIKQFYVEDLNIKNISLAIDILSRILNHRLPGRNDPCLCGNGKFKKCHFHSSEFLKSIPREQLKNDLIEFKNLSN